MTDQEHIRIFDSQGEDYKQAFQIFLNHTDQKRNAKRWLQQVVDDLPVRQVFVDAGAGNGELTRTFAAAFNRTIAIEPNAYLLNQLQQTVPTAEAIGLPILSAQPSAPGDLVLSSHTFYYIPADEWLAHLERLVSWMSPTGVTIIVLQNRESGCMNMFHHFFSHRFELRRTVDQFRTEHGNQYEVMTTLDPAHVDTPDLSPPPMLSPNSCSIFSASSRLQPEKTSKPILRPTLPFPVEAIAFPFIKTSFRSVPKGKYSATVSRPLKPTQSFNVRR